MLVLLVDDNLLMQQVLHHYLESQNYTVVLADDAASALALAQQMEFHLLLIDMRLPDMDGPQLLLALRTLPGMQRCPAIALSGLGGADRECALDVGFDLFLIKPVDLDVLMQALERLIDSSRP
ncbi:response regulator [Candidatus Oscillochloris fontis]|uniref:response regulator n=1 Tax=Candidatus Oscillochloris fontis TaxID=2496868 RepID=UPI00101D70CD|nr:response regulator [Candidatus Oscillochloris fontis]